MDVGLGRTSVLQDSGCYCKRGHHLIPFINSLYFPCGRDIQASRAAINSPLKGQSLTKPPWIAINTLPLNTYIYTHSYIYISPGWMGFTYLLPPGRKFAF